MARVKHDEYRIGSLLEYVAFGGTTRRVLITSKDDNIKNGRSGFNGVEVSDRSHGIWGYDDQITSVIRLEPEQVKCGCKGHTPENMTGCDAWICICGNNAMSSGFDTCTKQGRLIEPVTNRWQGHYLCNACFRVIESEHGHIINWVGAREVSA